MTPTLTPDSEPSPSAGFFATRPGYGVGVALLAALYLLTGYAGLGLAFIPPSVTLVWAPTGIAVAALFRGGLRFWPGVFLGAWLTNTLVLPWPSGIIIAAGIAIGNTLGPVLAVVLLKHGRFSPRFETRRDILAFATRPALAMLVTATNGAVCVMVGGVVPANQFLDSWLIWWLGDTAGVLVVGPVLLAFDRSAVPLRPVARLVELAVLLAVVFALAVLVFDPFAFSSLHLPLAFVLIFALVWVGLRYRVWPASVAVLILSVVAVIGTMRGNGPFGAEAEPTRQVLLWAFMTAAAVVTQLLAVLQRADEERQALERKMQEAQRLESLGILAGGVAHDFNNLLAGVLGHTELAAAAIAPDSPARPHIDAVQAGVQRASGLTRQLLAYSGRGMFVVGPVDLTGLVRQTEGLLRASVPRESELLLRLADDLPPVAADPTQLRQVLVNLVTNAGEALGERMGSVTVSTDGAELTGNELPDSYLFDPLPAGSYVVLTVTDDGSGMDEATQSRLFDPFFTTKFAGRGLGMSAVLGIVRGHRGGIRVTSRPGTGTTVTVYLPASDESLTQETLTTQLEATPVEQPSPNLEGVRASHAAPVSDVADPPPTGPDAVQGRPVVLVVDDEDLVRRVAQMMLEQLGYAALAAADGVEALELFRQHAATVRAVMLDLTMPVMDGVEVLAAIRQINPAMPVILCSGYTEDAVPESLLRAGQTAFLQKPFSLADLDRLVRAAVATSPPGG